MSNNGRLEKSVRNMSSGIIFRILTMITAFLVRTVFLKCLSKDYLSVNGLYGSILSMLSLAELGFGSAIVYNMYKPLAEKNYEKLSQLVRLYKKAYFIIGSVICVVGLCLVPFLDFIIKDKPDLPHLTFYYILFLLNTVLSYWFFAYRTSVINADQKSYIVSLYDSIFNIIKTVSEIAILLLFRNYTAYLLVTMFCTIGQNIALSVYAKKHYPIFDFKASAELPQNEKDAIFHNVKALMLQKISFKVLNSSDSIIISAFVGVGWVGLLSNYLLIVDMIVAFLSQVTVAVTSSLGNYFAQEDRENGYLLFRRIDFLNYWLYSFSAIALVTLLSPFVTLWIGTDFLVSRWIVIALITRFFVEGYMNTMSMFRSTLGLFTQGQYFPLLVAGINIILSIGLSFPFGTAGVLIATPLSRLFINVWYTPLVIHRDGFKKPVRPFFLDTLCRVAVTVAIAAAMLLLSDLIFAGGITILTFAAVILLTAIIPNLVLFLLFRKRNEFRYFSDIALGFLQKLLRKN